MNIKGIKNMRTAKWIEAWENSPVYNVYKCSACGGLYEILCPNNFNYCPNCGSYMKTINKVKPIRKCCKTCKYSKEVYTFYDDGTFDGSYMKKLVCLGEKESPEVSDNHRCKQWRAK